MRLKQLPLLWVLLALLLVAPLTMAATVLPETAVSAQSAQTETTGDTADTPPTEETESNLPPEINRILASLSLYILTMFTLALGTEVAVDVAKHLFGLKSKPTARTSLKEFGNLLPGNPSDFGISVEEHAHLQSQIQQLQAILEPVATADDIIGQIKDGAIVDAANNFLQAVNALPPGTTLEDSVRQQLANLATMLAERIQLPASTKDAVVQQVITSINNLSLNNMQDTARESLVMLRSGLLTAWIREQLTDLSANTKLTIEQKYESLIRPQLANLGFSPTAQNAIHTWFQKLLNEVDTYSSHQVDIYLKSLNELLRGVESQRYQLQGPARRFWRRLRRADNFLGTAITWLENMWNKLGGRHYTSYEDVANKTYVDDAYSVGRVMLELDRQHKADGEIRVRWLRLLSIGVGIMLAYSLQIDSADMLNGLLPLKTTGFLKTVLIGEGTVLLGIAFFRDLTAGILLSGLAASAGSNFWHDRLNQIQAVRTTAEAAATVLKSVAEDDKSKSSN